MKSRLVAVVAAAVLSVALAGSAGAEDINAYMGTSPENNAKIAQFIKEKTGITVNQTFQSFGEIEARVLDMHTVKPLDDAAVLAAARDTGRIVVAEEHLAHGGLGSVVAMSVVRQHPVPMRFVTLGDTFAESGTPEELLKKYGLTSADIVREALALVKK